MSNGPVSRSLSDPAIDDIDHALGRPERPLEPTWRNIFLTEGEQADLMSFSVWWKRIGTVTGGLVRFEVTPEGRRALQNHLEAQRAAGPTRGAARVQKHPRDVGN